MDILKDFLNPSLIGTAVGAIGLLFVILFVFNQATRWYHRVPPSKVMVIYGRGQTKTDPAGRTAKTGMKLVTGGGALVIPVLEDYKFLDLTVMTIKMTGDSVYDKRGLKILVDWVCTAQLDSTDSAMLTAARAFLGMTQEQIQSVILNTLSANARAIIGQMTVEEVHRDRDIFVRKVQELAADEMARMGISIISLGVVDITDEDGYFKSLAAPAIALVKRDAAISQAEAEKEARIRAAEAKRQAEQAELQATREVVEQRQALELREVEKKQAVALAQAAADNTTLEQRAKVVARQQEVEVLTPARAEADAAKIVANGQAEKLRIETDAKNALADKTAEALARQAKTRAAAEADAEVQKATAAATATRTTAEANAEAIRAQKLAEAEGVRATGSADAESIKAKLLAEAEGRQADASAIRAKLLAEAEGQTKLAEAVAAQGQVNLTRELALAIVAADVEKAQAIAGALAGLGGNVKIVQMGNSQSGQNPLVELISQIPELAAIFNEKAEALTGNGVEDLLSRVLTILRTAGKSEAPTA